MPNCPPALLSTGEDRPIGLFTYLLLLNSGLAWVAFRKGWPWLTALSVTLTALYQWGWVATFLDASRLPLAMSIFAVFPILHVMAVVLARHGQDQVSLDPRFTQTATLASTLPLLFALYAAAVPVYGDRYALLFGFLFLTVAGLAVVSATGGPPILRQLGSLASVVVFAVWFTVSYRSTAWPGILAFIALFVLFHLGMAVLDRRAGRAAATPARTWGAMNDSTSPASRPATRMASCSAGVLIVAGLVGTWGRNSLAGRGVTASRPLSDPGAYGIKRRLFYQPHTRSQHTCDWVPPPEKERGLSRGGRWRLNPSGVHLDG